MLTVSIAPVLQRPSSQLGGSGEFWPPGGGMRRQTQAVHDTGEAV